MKKYLWLLLLLPTGVYAQNQARMISGTNNITTCPYTIAKQDVTKLDVFITSSACAVTLPAATTGGYGKGSIFSVKNNGTGSVTITISGGESIDGSPSVTLLPGAGMDIYSTGTGYSSQPGAGGGGGGGGGINPPAGDIGGNAVVPLVISTHLNSPLPILQGGTGTQTPALVAGTNINITGAWPNQTIAATAQQSCWLNNGSVLTCEPLTNAIPPVIATDNPGNTRIDLSVAPCAAGGSHTSGIVTDPGVSPDLTQFLRSDCTFAVPSAVVTAVPNPLTASNLSNTTAPWKINADVSFGGNNPYIDIRTYGARAVLPNSAPAVPGITASITGGVASATLSSASTFQNGDGVVIWGAGATNVMSTPAAPTVTPSVSASETGSLLDVTGPTGATSYSYQVVARDTNGGLTAASTATTISTGQATLGPNAISISSISLSNNTVSVVTSGAHTLAVGALVIIEGVTVTGGINPFNGWFIVGASADNTHFTYNTMSDSRNGAVTTGASGNAHWWNSNHITWTAVTGAFQYYIYGRTGGSMALIGVSWPQNSGFTSERTHLAFDDFGSTLTTAPGLPAYVPTGTPPGAATNDMLVTTISSGAGTTSLTLADNAGNTVTGATILFDNGTALLAAANAANISNTTSGTVYIPWPSTPFAYFVINSPVTLPNYSAILQNGTVYLNETMTASGVTWKGMSRQQGAYPQFAISKTQQIYINNANPGIYTTDTSFFSFTTLQGQHLTNNNLMLEDLTGGGIPAGTLESVQFGLSVGGGTDYMSTGLVIRGNHAVGGASDMILHNVTFVSSQNTAYTTSCTPGLYADNFGSFSIDHIFFSGRGLLHRPTTSGGNIIGDGFSYAQANYMPMYASTNVDGGVISSNVKLTNVTLDTTLQPAFANLSNGGLSMNLILEYSTGVSNAATVTGSPTTFVNFFGPTIPAPGMNSSNEFAFNANVNDGIFGRTNGFGLRTENASVQIGSGYSLFTAGNSPAAPTCSANSGGSVPVSTLSYVYVPVWPNGSEGTPSLACSVTTTGGNQTVGMTWTAVTGAKGYNIYRNNFLANIGGCGTPQVTTASGTDSSSFTCGTGQPTAFAGAGGPAGMQGGNIWGNTETIGQYIDFAGLGSAPSNPAAGFCRTYYDSVAGTTKGINSTGASCSPTGGGGGSGTVIPALQNSVTYYDQAGTVAHVAGVAPPTGPASVPSFWVTIPGSPPAPILAGIPGRTVSGASDTVLVTDRVSTVTYTNAGATAVSLPGAGTTGFGSNFCFKMKVQGSGAVATVTPAAGTINGGATQTVLQGQQALVCSFDNSNYIATIADPPAAAGSNIALTRGDSSLSFASSAGGGTVTHTGGLTSGQLLKGNGTADITVGDLSGDCSTSGSTVTTCTALNGTAFSGTNGNVVGFGASNIPVDTGIVAANVITSTGTLLSGNVVSGTAAKNVGPTSIATTTLVTAASNAGFANQLCASASTNKACAFTSLSDLSSTDYTGATTGAVNVLAGCPTNTATALTAGMMVAFLPNLANTTTTPTLNLCTLGAKTITKLGTAALATNDLITTAIAVARYDGTGWELQNPQTSSGGGSSALSSITAAAAGNTIANGNNIQAWNWQQTTNTQSTFKFGETAAAMNGTVSGNFAQQGILSLSALSGSTATPLTVQQVGVTGSLAIPLIQGKTTWNGSSLYQGLVLAVVDTAHGAGSKIVNVYGGSGGTTSEMSLDTAGNLTIAGNLSSTDSPNYLGGAAISRWGTHIWSHANGGVNNVGAFAGPSTTCTTAGDTGASATDPSYKTCGTGATANTAQYIGFPTGDTFIGSVSNPTNLHLSVFAKMSATTTTRFWPAEISNITTQSTLGGSDSPTANNVAAIRYSSVAGDTNYMLVLCNAAACNATSTGVAADTNVHRFEIRLNDATGTATGCVDGTCISSTTDYPNSVATGASGAGIIIDNTTTTVETMSWSESTLTTIK